MTNNIKFPSVYNSQSLKISLPVKSKQISTFAKNLQCFDTVGWAAGRASSP